MDEAAPQAASAELTAKAKVRHVGDTRQEQHLVVASRGEQRPWRAAYQPGIIEQLLGAHVRFFRRWLAPGAAPGSASAPATLTDR